MGESYPTRLQQLAAENDVSGMLNEVNRLLPLHDWVLAKGKVTEAEPLYGFQLMLGYEQVVSTGEDDSICLAILKGTAMALNNGGAG